MKNRNKFLGETVVLNFNGDIRQAKIEDIEFETNLGKPLFLMVSPLGNRFWLTREELKDHEVISK
jgi:hypothetical protein